MHIAATYKHNNTLKTHLTPYFNNDIFFKYKYSEMGMMT
jgi:hypothetical protein